MYIQTYTLIGLPEENLRVFLYPFLVTDAPAQILQQECQRLAGACKRFFEGKGGYPRFKRRGASAESIRYPQFVRFDLKRRQLFLPKLG